MRRLAFLIQIALALWCITTYAVGEEADKASDSPIVSETVSIAVDAMDAAAGVRVDNIAAFTTNATEVTGVTSNTIAGVEDDEPEATGDLTLPNGRIITELQLQQITEKMQKSRLPRLYYHWGSITDSIRWGRSGRITRAELLKMALQNDPKKLAGNGFYLAESPESSTDYGVVPCYVAIPAGTPELDLEQRAIQSVLHYSLMPQEKAVLGTRIPFIHAYSAQSKWFVTHSAALLRNITCGNVLLTPNPIHGRTRASNDRIPDNKPGQPGKLRQRLLHPDGKAASQEWPIMNFDHYAVRRNERPGRQDYHFSHVRFDKIGPSNNTLVPHRLDSQYEVHRLTQQLIHLAETWTAKEAGVLGEEAKRLQAFMLLMGYLDGPSLVAWKTKHRSVSLNASEPNSPFALPYFNGYFAAFSKILTLTFRDISLGIVNRASGKFGPDGVSDIRPESTTHKKAWVKHMADEVLPKLYRLVVTGDSAAPNPVVANTTSGDAGAVAADDAASIAAALEHSIWRSKPLRIGTNPSSLASNNSINATFPATANQLHELEKNPHLVVRNEPTIRETYVSASQMTDKQWKRLQRRREQRYLQVSYHHPDAKILRSSEHNSKMSMALRTAMRAAHEYRTPETEVLFANHTAWLLKEITEQSLGELFGKDACDPLDPMSYSGAWKGLLRLESISPFREANHLVARMFFFATMINGCKNMQHIFLPDFIFRMGFPQTNQRDRESNKGYKTLKLALLSEMISALVQGVKPNYSDLPEWSNFITDGFRPYQATTGHFHYAPEFNEALTEILEEGNVLEFMDEIFKMKWPGRDTP